ncbi:MAG: regulatory protein RecX [Paludibacter sp.]|jgi:regulatory protein|nr:regulatory protein RecX [Paludibacter sp.]
MTYEEALHKAAAYCSQAEHCTFEVKEKLSRWEIAPNDQKTIIHHLEKENFLSNNRYALAFVKDKFRYNKWGKIRIQLELQRRQIDKETISEALESLEEDAYLNLAVDLAQSKLRGLKYKDIYERDGKLFRYMAGKGFESGIIREALKILSSGKEDA